MRLASEQRRLAGFAAVATGLFGPAEAAAELGGFRERKADTDAVARHQAAMGLVHLGRRHPGLLASLIDHPSPAARLGAVLAMRRLHDPSLALMLSDPEPSIVAEAARAINDEPIDEVMPALADMLDRPSLDATTLRRSLNAAYRRGNLRDATAVAAIAGDASTLPAVRVVAAKMLRTWNTPEPLDTVNGRWRPLPNREIDGLRDVVVPHLPSLLAGTAPLRDEALQIAIALDVKDLVPNLTQVFEDPVAEVTLRVAAFRGLVALAEQPESLIQRVLASNQEAIRLAAVEALAARQPAEAANYFEEFLKGASVPALQTSLRLIAELVPRPAGKPRRAEGTATPRLPKPRATELLSAAFARLADGSLPAAAMLDLLEAAEAVNTPALVEQVAAFRAEQAATASPEQVLATWSECLEGGDPELGRVLFMGATAASCRRCHQVAGVGGLVGPQLSGIARERDRAYLLESIVAPSAKIAKGFETVVILTAEGRIVSGILREETETQITLVTPDGEVVTIAADDVDDRSTGLSGMPADLIKSLSRRDIRDLVAFLATLTEPPPQGH